ncbi:unnamed protein product, partial [Rotaria sp. Silwood2]
MAKLSTHIIDKTTTGSSDDRNTVIESNVLLVWFSSIITERDDHYGYLITHLQTIINDIHVFEDADQCVDFVTDINHKKVLLIITDDIDQYLVPLIHDTPQLDSIYLFSQNKTINEQWTKEWYKIKGIFFEFSPIIDSIKLIILKNNRNSIGISFISVDDASDPNLDQLDQSFMYTQLLKDILLDSEYDEGWIENFATYCRNNNSGELNNINRFEREYRDHLPVWWYTSDSFLCPMLNRALRTQEVETIIKMGFFIQDLYRQIEELHSDQFANSQAQLLIVYRGQGISSTDFEKLKKAKGGLISFNNFLSTSADKDVSSMFAESILVDPELIAILFEITVDTSIVSPHFAFVDNVSYFRDSEREILFSMHSVFRIRDILSMSHNDRFWKVDITLTADNDKQLSVLTTRMREEIFAGTTGWSRLGKLLIRLGAFDKAEQVYKAVLEQETNIHEKIIVYHQLGSIKNEQGNYSEAIKFNKNVQELVEKSLHSKHSVFAHSQAHMGLMYETVGESDKAIDCLQKALDIIKQARTPDLHNLAACYQNLGSVYQGVGQHQKALSFYEKAMDTFEKILPPNHPDRIECYSKVASVYYHMGEYAKALSCHMKISEIREKVLPPNHPNLALSHSHI